MLQTVNMVLGNEMAPWEDESAGAAVLKPLGYFKKPVLALLSRDPKDRPTMQEFRLACQRVLANSIT
jgi:hypothetical protein